MKARRVFMHIGLAAGYLSLFYLLQFWVSNLYTIGMSLPLAFSDPGDAASLDELLYTRLYEQIDIVMLLVYIGCLLFYGCLLYAEHPDAPLRAARIQRPRSAAMLWAPLLLGVSYFFAVQGSLSLIPEDAPLLQEYIEAASSIEAGKFPFLTFITTVIGAPVIEELVFRAFVYRHLRRVMPLWLAVLLQSLLFALAHGQLLWMSYTFAMGLFCALLYDYFDSLLPCILLHLSFNGSNYLPFLETLALEPVGWVIVLLASLLLCALTMLLLLLYRRHTAPERRPDYA